MEYSNVPTPYGPEGSGNEKMGNSWVKTADALISKNSGRAPSVRHSGLVSDFFNDASTAKPKPTYAGIICQRKPSLTTPNTIKPSPTTAMVE